MTIKLLNAEKEEKKEPETKPEKAVDREKKIRERIKQLKDSGTLLDSEKGTRFFHRVLCSEAKKRNKIRRKLSNQSKRRNRGNR